MSSQRSNHRVSTATPEGDDLSLTSPDPSRSRAKFLRRQLKGPAALAVRRGAEAAGVSYRLLGLVIDAPKSHVGQMASPDHDKVIDAVRARMAPPEIAAAVARFVVEPHGKLVIDAPEVIPCSEAERTWRLTKEANELASVRAENLRDGAHNLGELESELKELRDDIAAKLEHEAHLVAAIAAMREGNAKR